MREAFPARLLQIHISERDRYQGKPLYEAIVARCREMKIAGATVFRGLEGYGESAEMHRAHLSRAMAAAEEMVDTGAMSVSDVEAVRVRKALTSDKG
jgi:PII-like signaling protein